ncbi:dihydrolipoamide acetyltransferase family protein [Enterococcus sp. LJL120]
MAIKEILMPSLGESVTEASVTQWLVKPGNQVKRYDPLMEVISDKVSTEIPSDFDGTIQEILVELDSDLPIGTPLMTIEVAGEADTTATQPPEAQQAKAQPEAASQSETTVSQQPEKTAPLPTEAKPEVANSSGKKRYSPAVMHIAQEKNINLEDIVGTGANGRITRKDVLNYTPTTPTESAESVSSKAPKPAQEPPAPAAKPKAEPISFSEQGDVTVPADPVRKEIAKRMVRSVNEIPHAWVMVEVDVSNIVKLRNSLKDKFKEQEGISLSYFPFFAKAVVQALKNNPKVNTSWQEGNIIYHKDINLSIAVTTEDNLFVPVIHQADNYSLAGLAKEINRLATEVRSNQLASKDMQGGTFTINNTGSIGSTQSMGIINYPQAAILQVESIVKRVVPSADGGIKFADMINLCLSIDHRILDGQQAGQFLKDIKDNLAKFNDEAAVY